MTGMAKDFVESRGSSSRLSLQAALEVFYQILGSLQSDGKTDQAVTYSRALPLFASHPGMRGRGGSGDQTLDARPNSER